MKRILSLILASLLALSVLASCAVTPTGTDTPATSSEAAADVKWLRNRIGTIPANVRVGLASSLGIDMTSFEDDGYMIRTENGETVVAGKNAAGLDRAVRAYAKAYEAGRADSFEEVYHEGYRIERLTVAGRDISEYTIVYVGGTSSVVGKLSGDDMRSITENIGKTVDNSYYAATQLRRLIKQACGAELPISDRDAAHMLKIDYLEDGKHGENGFTYEVKDGNVYFHGVGRANGCANAVYYFLEEECGWEGLLYGDSILAEADLIDIPNGTAADVDPMFDYCQPYNNRSDPYATDRWDITYYGSIIHACHGLSTMKWAGYNAKDKQPCFTDEIYYYGVYDEVTYYLEQNPGVDSVDISIGDNMSFCHCKNCMKVVGEENLSNAGPIVRFANKLDTALCETLPGRNAKLLIFAYHGCNIPPITKPTDNVYITVCDDGCCSMHYIDGTENCDPTFDFLEVMGNRAYSNKDYGEWIRGWCALSDNVYIWHYNLDGVFHQYTQTHNFYNDFRYFSECGAKGVFYEAECYGLGEERVRLEMLGLFNFHPDWTREEYDAALAALYQREFGDGGDYLLAYTKNYWNRCQLATGCHDCWGYTTLIMPEMFDYEFFHEDEEKALECVENAILYANCEQQQLNAERFSLDLLYKICYYNYFRAYDAKDTAEIARLSALYDTFWKRFYRVGYNGSYNKNPLCSTLESAAWNDWKNWREQLWDKDAEHLPAPTVERVHDAPVTEAPETEPPVTETDPLETEPEPEEPPYTEWTADGVLYRDEYAENGKRVYRIERIAHKDDLDWSKIPAAPIDKYGWVKCTEYVSYAQIVFAEDYGFLCRMTCVESNPVATFTKADSTVCLDSCMEFFVIFDGKSYLNLESNSIPAKCMKFGEVRENRQRVARKIPDQFLTVSEIGEKQWSLTYYLPMDQIQIFYPDVDFGTFEKGYEFSGNFYKTGGAEQTGNEHYGMWNEIKTAQPDFHQPKQFGIFIMN